MPIPLASNEIHPNRKFTAWLAGNCARRFNSEADSITDYSRNHERAVSKIGTALPRYIGVSDKIGSSEIAPAHRKPNGTERAECKCREQIHTRIHLPQKCAAECGDGHDHIANQVVKAEHTGFSVLGCEVHDQCLAGRFTKFLQPAQYK